MTKFERFMLRIIFYWVIGQTIFAWVSFLSGCTPHQSHAIYDGYEIRDGWATSRASE